MNRSCLALFLLAAACAPRSERRIDVRHLKVDVSDTAPSDCADDAREEDDSIAAVLGKIIPARPLTIPDEVSCPADDDFFRVDLFDAEGVVVPLDDSADQADRNPGKIELRKMNVRGDHYVRVRNLAGVRIPYSIELR